MAEDSLPEQQRHRLTQPEYRAWLALGAQGPDLFYHNQRRAPRSIQYGTLLHRHSYGSVTAAILAQAHLRGEEPDGKTAMYLAGFVGHAVLDRILHPYINFRAGRPVAGRPETDKLRSMHAFMERLVDVALLEYLRGIHPNEYDFYGTVTVVEKTGRDHWVSLMEGALASALPRAEADTKLSLRMNNAWLDAFGYYQFTRNVNPDYLRIALERETAGTISGQWLSLVHPLNVPSDLDVLNLEHRQWNHPCSSRRTSRESVPDMYDEGVRRTRAAVEQVLALWDDIRKTGVKDDTINAIIATVGDYNLSDGRPRKKPCRPRHMDPLPLPRLQELIRQSIQSGSGGLVQSIFRE